MINSPHSLLELIHTGKIVRNLSDRELLKPEGVGFDLCLSSLSSVGSGGGSLRTATRRTPENVLIQANENNCFYLESGRTYLATTTEEFDLPSDLAAVFFPRSTLFRSGVIFQSSVLPAGYVGPMVFSLTNTHYETFEIEKGARFAHAVFLSVTGDVGLYKGQWQGGRVSQPLDEGQI